MKKIKLTESELYRIINRVIRENQEENLGIREKLNQIFFGNDEYNLFSQDDEKGYLSSDWRLDKKISPKQRIKRINKVINELESYIQDLRTAVGSEESFLENPDYEKQWSRLESGDNSDFKF